MKTIIFAVAFIASAVHSLDLTFVSDANCTGTALYGRQNLPTISCYNMSYLDPTESVIIANIAVGERVSFFSDTACEKELYASSANVCYTEPDSRVRSFQVQQNSFSEDVSTTTDVVPYGVRLSNYKGLAQFGPYSIHLKFSQFAIGLILSVTGQLVALSAIATGCAIYGSTNVLSLFSCIAGPMASVISWVGGWLVHNSAKNINAAIEMGTGTFVDVKRKRAMINNANLDYMSSIMKRDGNSVGDHVGFQTRDMGDGVEQRSPLYEVDFGMGGKYHMSAFYDERSSDFVHHIHRAEESKLEARYDSLGRRQVQYDDVRWNTNGLDWTACRFGGSTSGWSAEPSENWQTALDQLNCQIQDHSKLTSATNVEVDLYNEETTVIGSVQIVGYRGSLKYNSPPSCSNPHAGLNEDCIIA